MRDMLYFSVFFLVVALTGAIAMGTLVTRSAEIRRCTSEETSSQVTTIRGPFGLKFRSETC